MTLDEIKAAVLAGKRVHWGNPGYDVILDSANQWLIIYTATGYCWGLTWRDGVTINGEPQDFFIGTND